MSKTILGTSTGFLYGGLNPVQELSGTTPTANLLTGSLDEFFTRTDRSGARSFLTDSLGSTLALVHASAAIQTSYTFEPFGNTVASGAATTNSFAYTARELDAGNLNLYFYRGRYYSPTRRRFVSEDPSEFGGRDANLYAYAFNGPTNFLDPLGLDGWTRFSGGLRAAGCIFETAAGVGLAAATGWTGVGAIGGGLVALHGVDQFQAGLSQLFLGCHGDSVTSQQPQIWWTQDLAWQGRLELALLRRPFVRGAGNIRPYEIGQKTLSASRYARYSQIADPVTRGNQIIADEGMLRALAPDIGVVSQFSKTIPQGLTPLATGAAGALGAGGSILAGRGCGCSQ